MSGTTPMSEMPGQEDTNDMRKLTEKLASSNRLPDKLMVILLNEEAPDAIWWLPNRGDTFIIHKEKFQDEILLKYFRGNKFKSLVRNLHRWGFKRLTSDAQPAGKTVAFSNPFFQKNHPELVLQATMVNHAKERKMAQKNQAMKKPVDDVPAVPECESSKKADPALHEAEVAAAAKSAAVRPNKGPVKFLSLTANPLLYPQGVPKKLPPTMDLSRLLGGHGRTLLSQRGGLLLEGASVGESNTLQFLSQGWPQRDSAVASLQGSLLRSPAQRESSLMSGMFHSRMGQFLMERGQPNGGLIPFAGSGSLASSFGQGMLGGAVVGLGSQLGSSLLNRADLELLQLQNRALQTRSLAQSSPTNPYQPN